MAYYENIGLEKGMYHTPGKSFTQVLEELDRSENYRGTALEGLDAYQRQLKRFAIKVSGPDSGTVEQFFQSGASAALFPEYVARAVRQGMDSVTNINDLVATVTKIDGIDYRTIAAKEEAGQQAEDVAKVNHGLIHQGGDVNADIGSGKDQGGHQAHHYDVVYRDFFPFFVRHLPAHPFRAGISPFLRQVKGFGSRPSAPGCSTRGAPSPTSRHGGGRCHSHRWS